MTAGFGLRSISTAASGSGGLDMRSPRGDNVYPCTLRIRTPDHGGTRGNLARSAEPAAVPHEEAPLQLVRLPPGLDALRSDQKVLVGLVENARVETRLGRERVTRLRAEVGDVHRLGD